MIKTARTFTPFDGGLSPLTDKVRGVPLFGNTPLIQDLINGNKEGLNDIKSRGSWSAEKDDIHSYHEEGSEYRLDDKLNKLDIERAKKRAKQGRLIVETEDGSRYEFHNQDDAAAQSRIIGKPIKRQWKAAAKTDVVAKTIDGCVEVFSKPQSGDGGVGAAFCFAEGQFLTCAHVIMPYKIGVYFDDNEFMSNNITLTVSRDGKSAPAKLLAVSLKKDIAIIEADFPSYVLGMSNSRSHLVGEDVIAVGSPKGFENNVSEGIISGIDRVVFSHKGAPKHIFTDAKILPGNSGGPLVSLIDNKVVGMIEIIVGEEAPYGLNAAIETEYLLSTIKEMTIST